MLASRIELLPLAQVYAASQNLRTLMTGSLPLTRVFEAIIGGQGRFIPLEGPFLTRMLLSSYPPSPSRLCEPTAVIELNFEYMAKVLHGHVFTARAKSPRLRGLYITGERGVESICESLPLARALPGLVREVLPELRVSPARAGSARPSTGSGAAPTSQPRSRGLSPF
ncbi:hypothetical protein YUYDRAFT_07104 [Streptomyces sp. ScaeMP-e48]|nr:hypothetical protein YUYDRAFT_07104 [Streptomyces sp. ScaeMP-e48]